MIERKEDAESIGTEKEISIVNWRFANGWANDEVNSTGQYCQITTWSDRESRYIPQSGQYFAKSTFS
jgi:hypothetical protein